MKMFFNEILNIFKVLFVQLTRLLSFIIGKDPKDTKQVKQIPELPEITCKNIMQIYDCIYDIGSTTTYRKYRNILLKQLRSNYAVF